MKSRRIPPCARLSNMHSRKTAEPPECPIESPYPLAADPNVLVPQLVANVYALAPAHVRRGMLEQLIKPLGVLSLVAVANGVFAKIRLSEAWTDIGVRFEDTQNIQASDVFALVNQAQEVSTHAMEGLSRLLAASPVLAGSAAAVLLMKLLLQRSQSRRQLDDDLDP